MAKILKYLFLLLFIAALIVGAFLVYTKRSLPTYEPVTNIYSSNVSDSITKDTISFLSWNIGYAGLGDDMDFFYDGGSKMRTSKERTLQNLAGIEQTLNQNRDADFVFLQEVDRDSKRSYGINQVVELGEKLSEYILFFAENYSVELVPMPVTNPLGKVNSGLLTLCKQAPKRVVRHSFPDKHPWPTGMFMPKRCFLEVRYNVRGGKGRELVVINTHNSAYDDGSLRKLELEALRRYVLDEYKKGNWVVVGGDWNQNPSGYIQQNPDEEALKNFTPQQIPSGLMPKGWHWAWDHKFDSNRFLNKPFIAGKTMTTTIDLFLLSPNIELIKAEILNDNFAFSDHQPLRVKILLNKN